MQPLRLVLTERSGSTAPEPLQFFLAFSNVFQSFFPGALERAGHQTVLRLDACELAFGPLSFIACSLYRQHTLVALTFPGLLRLLECRQRGINTGRCQRC